MAQTKTAWTYGAYGLPRTNSPPVCPWQWMVGNYGKHRNSYRLFHSTGLLTFRGFKLMEIATAVFQVFCLLSRFLFQFFRKKFGRWTYPPFSNLTAKEINRFNLHDKWDPFEGDVVRKLSSQKGDTNPFQKICEPSKFQSFPFQGSRFKFKQKMCETLHHLLPRHIKISAFFHDFPHLKNRFIWENLPSDVHSPPHPPRVWRRQGRVIHWNARPGAWDADAAPQSHPKHHLQRGNGHLGPWVSWGTTNTGEAEVCLLWRLFSGQVSNWGCFVETCWNNFRDASAQNVCFFFERDFHQYAPVHWHKYSSAWTFNLRYV